MIFSMCGVDSVYDNNNKNNGYNLIIIIIVLQSYNNNNNIKYLICIFRWLY